MGIESVCGVGFSQVVSVWVVPFETIMLGSRQKGVSPVKTQTLGAGVAVGAVG
jgi:hypothetical protein